MFYIAKLSKEEEIVKLKKVFMELDTDNTGTLSVEEIKKGFNIFGIKIEKVDKLKISLIIILVFFYTVLYFVLF